MRRARPETDTSQTHSLRTDVLHTDVLVLGAGLAGLRAAWAAREAAPHLRVTLLSPFARPSGSSFANRNNALGMQVPRPDQAAAFMAEALRLAAPGLALPGLVAALAEDAPARLGDLLALGLNFRREPSGSLRLFPGCFSTIPRAVVFDGLTNAHAAFLARASALGVELLCGFEAVGLTQDEPGGRVRGALLQPLRRAAGGRKTLVAHARAVIAALGGPAPLFARRICGPGGSGLSYGLLKDAGTRLANTEFLQWFWVEAANRDFVNPGELAWPERLAPLAEMRRQHCPMAFGLADAALDLEMLARPRPNGILRVGHPQRGPLELVLAAHAGNGGALIDAQGRTNVAGLYACGECAAGMHGANRLGGAMVLSALVFGARAGKAAAQEAAGMEAMGMEAAEMNAGATETGRRASGSAARGAGPDGEVTARNEAPKGMRWLRRNMQRFGLPGTPDGPARTAFLTRLRSIAKDARRQRRERLLALSALAVLEGTTTRGSAPGPRRGA